MTSLKPAASLSSGLLVRKGGATPANLLFAYPPIGPSEIRDMPRFEARMPGAPDEPPQPANRDEHASAAARRRTVEALQPRGRGAKVSLRLDAERHQRLRVAAFHEGRSGQQLLIAALDAYLESTGASEIDARCSCLRQRSK
jgi:hypothetical protein